MGKVDDRTLMKTDGWMPALDAMRLRRSSLKALTALSQLTFPPQQPHEIDQSTSNESIPFTILRHFSTNISLAASILYLDPRRWDPRFPSSRECSTNYSCTTDPFQPPFPPPNKTIYRLIHSPDLSFPIFSLKYGHRVELIKVDSISK